MISEEEEEVVQCTYDKEAAGGRAYMVCTDPLDGSSNIDCNVPVGTIFSIFGVPTEGEVNDDVVLQCSNTMLGSGYVLYGPATVYVYSLWNGTHGFILDDASGLYYERFLNMKVPKAWKCYSINEANMCHWKTELVNYVSFLKMPDASTDKAAIGARYVGSLVADFHRNLLYGGIYMYPGDDRNETTKKGKLRLMYECAPVALLVEQAGGAATDGTQRLLDLTPDSIHDKTPIFIGNTDLVEIAGSFMKGETQLASHIARPLISCNLTEAQLAKMQFYNLDACPLPTPTANAALVAASAAAEAAQNK